MDYEEYLRICKVYGLSRSVEMIYKAICMSILVVVKLHKQNIPLRPVISMINTAQLELVQYLDTKVKLCVLLMT